MTDNGWRRDLRIELLEAETKSIPWGSPLRIVEEIDSTNAELLRSAAEGMSEGAVLLADRQTAGRGRSRREWFNPRGVNIAMSILLRPEMLPRELPAVVMPISLGVCLALHEIAGSEFKIKWPNDIVYKDKKLCGILCESRLFGSRVEALVVGVGINVNTDVFPLEIQDTAISLRQIAGKSFCRDTIAAAVLRQCYACYQDYFCNGKQEDIWQSYCAHSATLHRRVSIGDETGRKMGVVEHIDKDGALTLLTDDGCKGSFVAGEVSLRPL